jgi:hypothetical protein
MDTLPLNVFLLRLNARRRISLAGLLILAIEFTKLLWRARMGVVLEPSP